MWERIDDDRRRPLTWLGQAKQVTSHLTGFLSGRAGPVRLVGLVGLAAWPMVWALLSVLHDKDVQAQSFAMARG